MQASEISRLKTIFSSNRRMNPFNIAVIFFDFGSSNCLILVFPKAFSLVLKQSLFTIDGAKYAKRFLDLDW